MQSGFVEPRPVDVDGDKVRAWFCPGFGDALAHRIAKACGRARRRDPDLLAGAHLRADPRHALPDRVRGKGRPRRLRRPDADRGGALPVADERRLGLEDPAARRRCSSRAPFSGKRSTPYTPTSVHDYMHAKVTVADDIVFCGSFNLSRSGERNAENMLEIHDARSPTSWPRTSTPCARAIRLRTRAPACRGSDPRPGRTDLSPAQSIGPRPSGPWPGFSSEPCPG